MTQTQPRRAELGAFLKARRASVQPEDVGMPPGVRRRTPGLRREEVALLAGVGITWYTWLEQGRPINASAQVLDAIAQTLRMDRDQRWHMYRLTESIPARRRDATPMVPAAVHVVVRSLDPLPVIVTNDRLDRLARNDASANLYPGWHRLPCLHNNTVWCVFTEPAARERIVEFEEEARLIVAQMRAGYANHVGDPEWDEDIRRLCALSPHFARLWARHEVAGPQLRTRRIAHPEVGALTFQILELDVAIAPGLRLVVSTPADDATWAKLPLPPAPEVATEPPTSSGQLLHRRVAQQQPLGADAGAEVDGRLRALADPGGLDDGAHPEGVVADPIADLE